MMGDSGSEDGPEWRWAHILWQRHGLRMEEFAYMDRQFQLAYIASELAEEEAPVDSANQIKKGLFKKK